MRILPSGETQTMTPTPETSESLLLRVRDLRIDRRLLLVPSPRRHTGEKSRSVLKSIEGHIEVYNLPPVLRFQ